MVKDLSMNTIIIIISHNALKTIIKNEQSKQLEISLKIYQHKNSIYIYLYINLEISKKSCIISSFNISLFRLMVFKISY